MAWKHLTTSEMLDLSATWLDTTVPPKGLVAENAEFSAAWERLIEARQQLQSTRSPQERAQSENLGKLEEDARSLDGRHDSVVRALFFMLTACAHLETSQERADELLALRDRLLPDRLSSIQLSFRKEAELAAQVDQTMTDGERELLSVLPTPRGNLLDVYNEWMDCARGLGRLCDELEAARRKYASIAEEGEELRARNDWIRAMGYLVTTIEVLGPKASPLKIPLRKAREMEKMAAFRKAGLDG